MVLRIAIREEDKNIWERRTPLIPEHVEKLCALGLKIQVQQSARRIHPDGAYAKVGAEIVQAVAANELVLGIKEMPVDFFEPGNAYMFFSHTIKGQAMNMGMLARLRELGCTLFDYELITDAKGRRLVFFGPHAGRAGMIDTLWAFGRRQAELGVETPFLALEPAHHYPDLVAAKEKVARIGQEIRTSGLPPALAPLLVGITGYGNVSCGAQEILDLLPCEEISPWEVSAFLAKHDDVTDRVIKVVYHEEHLAIPRETDAVFNLNDYYDHPEKYQSCFGPHLEHLSILVNGIYWDERYPHLATREQLAALMESGKNPRLCAIGDISCDVNGALACTVRETDPGEPVFIYDPLTGKDTTGFAGPGFAVMSVYNLPCELPTEASLDFSTALLPFIPDLAAIDLAGTFADLSLPEPLKKAVILWRGEFTPDYSYMLEFLEKGE